MTTCTCKKDSERMDTSDPYDSYTFIKEIRSGGEGKAILMEKDGVQYICKQRIFESLAEANAGLKEAYTLASIKDENIVKFEEVFLRSIPGDKQIYLCIMLEYCPKGDLLDFLHELVTTTDHSPTHSTTTSNVSDTSSVSSLSGDAGHVSTTHGTPPRSPGDTSPAIVVETGSVCLIRSAKELIKKIIERDISHFQLRHRPSRSSVSLPTENSSGNLHTESNISTTFSDVSMDSLSSPNSHINRSQVFIQKSVLLEWLTQIALGVQALHKERLIHRDLKCENVFITGDDRLKIGDFGLATKNGTGKGRVGTYMYCAPEVLENQPYNRSADIFSLGCIFYELITLKLLVKNKRYFAEEIIADNFDKLSFLADFPQRYSYFGPLVLRMLDKNPSHRPSIETILDKILEVDDEHSIQSKSKLQLENFKGIKRQLSKTDFKEAATILARAFKNDPRYVKLFPADQESSHKHLKDLFYFSVKVMAKNNASIWGYFGTDNKLKSVCLWYNPDKKKEIKFGDIFIGGLTFMTKVGISKAKKGSDMIHAINDIMVKENDEKHWFLAYAGTDDDHRNGGIGSYLTSGVLEWADHSQYKCKTMVFSRDNFPFLQRLGFEVTREVRDQCGIPKNIEAVWILTRNPKPKHLD
ncbi:putative protein serine/threonine kinase [Heterostelium album PN500]|uniref:non-specific serine/threonine protein kinase n=1 Tax=Heterostelium pallidum (strain ATCC 26659 / Pp 5 / PN500) TaxID=670386 RepID=D3BPU7_HETP5|nr:putative protein serine/threonine kinase [Heterostelium album PN500]EFA76230.1 putative protein serine/threonine kinase [Heterostelium album PN500]|eukprot:XP_020428363.1 putative protein serine/threonine kinase [Heterostelium album PN500]